MLWSRCGSACSLGVLEENSSTEDECNGWKQIASDFVVPELFLRVVMEVFGYQPKH